MEKYLRATPEQIAKLETAAAGPTPVYGASTALAHARRGYGCPAPEALEQVFEALDGWDGKRVPIRDLMPGVITPYGTVITALTHFAGEMRTWVRSHSPSLF